MTYGLTPSQAVVVWVHYGSRRLATGPFNEVVYRSGNRRAIFCVGRRSDRINQFARKGCEAVKHLIGDRTLRLHLSHHDLAQLTREWSYVGLQSIRFQQPRCSVLGDAENLIETDAVSIQGGLDPFGGLLNPSDPLDC